MSFWSPQNHFAREQKALKVDIAKITRCFSFPATAHRDRGGVFNLLKTLVAGVFILLPLKDADLLQTVENTAESWGK
jgi:hypothetical protein